MGNMWFLKIFHVFRVSWILNFLEYGFPVATGIPVIIHKNLDTWNQHYKRIKNKFRKSTPPQPLEIWPETFARGWGSPNDEGVPDKVRPGFRFTIVTGGSTLEWPWNTWGGYDQLWPAVTSGQQADQPPSVARCGSSSYTLKKIKRKFRNPTPPQPLEIMARNLREGVGLGPT